jgi:hypothetical protein
VAPEIPDVPKPPRILIAASRHPWPARRGDQIRALQVAEMLAAEHRVTLLVPQGAGPPEPVPFEIATYPPATRGTAALGLARALVGRAPLQSGLFRSPALGDALARLAPAHDLVILQLVRLAPYLERVHPAGGRPVLVDLVDSLAVSTARRAELDRRLVRLPLREEARRLARWERLVVRRTAGALVVSGRDRGAIAAGLDPEEATRLHVVLRHAGVLGHQHGLRCRDTIEWSNPRRNRHEHRTHRTPTRRGRGSDRRGNARSRPELSRR